MLKRQQLSEAPINLVIDDICSIHTHIRADWSESSGWAPAHAAEVLGRSRLDWLCSLAQSLRLWFRDDIGKDEREGNLILAWANLGAVVEGSMKFLLSIWIEPYFARVASGNGSDKASFFRAFLDRDEARPRSPDELMLEKLRQFFDKEIWNGTPEHVWSDWVLRIAQTRNAIHAYTDRDIATFERFESDVRMYWRFLNELIMRRLPEPPDRSYAESSDSC